MPTDDLTVRIKLDDDLSRPMDLVRQKVKGTTDEITRAGRSSSGTAAELTRMERAASAAGSTVGYLGSHLLVANRNTSLLGGAVRSLGFAYAGAEVIRFGIRAVQSAQQAKGAFEGLLGSGQDAKQLYADLGKIKNPFGINALTDATQQLLAYGVAADQVVPGVQGIADAVSKVHGGGNAFSAVAGTLGDINSSAKLSSDQLRQLQQQGLAAANVLGQAHGMTGQQLVGALDSGKLKLTGAQAYRELISGFEQQASGSAATASQTLQGTLSGLGDTFAASVNKAIGPEQLRDLTSAVQGMAEILPPLATAATPFLHVLGSTLGFLGDHPHLTEGLAGLLIFREVAGYALSTSEAIRSITGALASGNTGSALQQLLGVTGGGPGGGGGGGGLDGLQDPLDAANNAATPGSRAATVLAAGSGAVGSALGAYSALSVGSAVENKVQGSFGHGYDNKSWHIQDAGKAAADVGKAAGAGALAGAGIGAAVGSVVPIAGTAVGAVLGGGGGAVVGTLIGSGKSIWDYSHDQQGYSLSDAGRKARDAAQAGGAGVIAPQIHVNVQGGDPAQQYQQMLDYLSSPSGRAWYAQQYAQQLQTDRERQRGGG